MALQDAPMNYSEDAWRRLWAAMDAARIARGASWRTYYGWAGLARETVIAMKDGQGIKNEHKLTGIDFASKWRYGSARAVLEGGEPEPAPPPEPDTPSVRAGDVLVRLDHLEAWLEDAKAEVLSAVRTAIAATDARLVAVTSTVESNAGLLAALSPVVEGLVAEQRKRPTVPPVQPVERKRSPGHRAAGSGGANTPPRGVRRR